MVALRCTAFDTDVKAVSATRPLSALLVFNAILIIALGRL
jgi:hypothetical protein